MALPTNAVLRIVAAVPAALLGGFSLLSLAASLASFGHDGDLDRAKRREKVEPAVLAAVAGAKIEAAGFFEPGRYRSDAAVALLALPRDARKATGRDVEKLLEDSLEKAPAAPYNWNRLAWFRLQRGDRQGAVKAWQMSVLTGRYVPGLMDARLTVAMALLPIRDPAVANLVIDQIRLAAEADLPRLARVARRTESAPVIRAVLWRDTTLLPEFDRIYKGLLWLERNRK